ncbi:MAG: hypothetical protein U0529_10925 [Thermoanaerobaculia bacterium]
MIGDGVRRIRDGSLVEALERIGFALVLLSVAAALAEPLRIHHDAASLLTSSLSWVEGRARLDEMAGMNLPLALYLYGLPAVVSSSLGLHPVPVFSAFTLGALLLSLLACRRLLGDGAPGSPEARSLLRAALAGLVLLSLEGPELTFGQRETFFLALSLPYFLVRWRRGEGAPPGLLAASLSGVAAALGALVKPHFLLVVLAAEGALRLAGGRPRLVRTPESLAFGATGLAYALHFFLLPDAVLGAFRAAAAGAAAGYRAYDAPLADLLLRVPHVPLLLAFAAALLASRRQGADSFARLAASFGGLGLGGLAVFLVQHKGFPYHLIPEVAGALLSATAIAACGATARLRAVAALTLRPLRTPFRLAAAAAPAGAALLAVVTASRLPESLEVYPWTAFEMELCERTSRGDEVLVFSTSVAPAYPALLRMDRRPYRKWMSPFMGIAFARAGEPRDGAPRYPRREEMGLAERQFIDDLGKDLRAAPPRVVLVAAHPPHQGLPARFDLVEYLRVAGFLDGAMSGFVRAGEGAGFVVYRPRAPKAAPTEAATHSSIGGVRPG